MGADVEGREDGQGLPVGMAMALAGITSLRRLGRYTQVALEAAELAGMRPAGAAPVFKVFIPPRPGGIPALPTFGAKYLPSWSAEAEQPTVRSYTAAEFSPARGRIEFLAFDPQGGDWWIDHLSIGDRLGVIGFKHELVVDTTIRTVLAVGDRSAAGAIVALARQLPDEIRLQATVPDAGWPADLLPERPEVELRHVDADEHGFPRIRWTDMAESAAAPAGVSLWLGGEARSVAALRSEALAWGLPPARIVAQPYWRAGWTRDEFDRELSRRYRHAAEQGLDIQDRVIAADLELS